MLRRICIGRDLCVVVACFRERYILEQLNRHTELGGPAVIVPQGYLCNFVTFQLVSLCSDSSTWKQGCSTCRLH